MFDGPYLVAFFTPAARHGLSPDESIRPPLPPNVCNIRLLRRRRVDINIINIITFNKYCSEIRLINGRVVQ